MKKLNQTEIKALAWKINKEIQEELKEKESDQKIVNTALKEIRSTGKYKLLKKLLISNSGIALIELGYIKLRPNKYSSGTVSNYLEVLEAYERDEMKDLGFTWINNHYEKFTRRKDYTEEIKNELTINQIEIDSLENLINKVKLSILKDIK